MAFLVAKFGTSLDIDFLSCLGFKVGIANISGPSFKSIEFSQENGKSEAAQTNNSRVYRVERYVGKVTVRYQSSFVSAVMLDIKNKMNSDLLVTFWDGSIVLVP